MDSIETTSPEVETRVSGNRCGHSPNQPQWHLLQEPERNGPLPRLVQDCLEALLKYWEDPSTLKPLAELDVSERPVNAGKRRNRSEAREADVLTIAAVLHTMDVTTLCMGTPRKDGEILYRSTKELAYIAGFLDPNTQLPNKRFKRSFSRLRRSGMITTKRVSRINKDGSVRGGISVKVVSENFLVLLLGGTEQARQKVARCRSSHSRVSKSQRGRSRQVAQQVQQRNQRQATVEAIQARPSGDEAYQAAKQQHHSSLMAGGLPFAQVMERMRQFPSYEAWSNTP
ncbi:MAG: hypothetical protein ACRC8D_07160 [Aeromonas sp.]